VLDIFDHANSGLSGTRTHSKLFVSKLVPGARDREDTDPAIPAGFDFEMGMLLISSQHPIRLLSRFCAALYI